MNATFGNSDGNIRSGVAVNMGTWRSNKGDVIRLALKDPFTGYDPGEGIPKVRRAAGKANLDSKATAFVP